MGENERLEAAIGGDADALAELLESEGPRIRAIVERELPSRFQSLLSADDVMQQTYADAFLSISGFVPRGDGAFGGWLLKLAKRNLVDAIRMLSAEKRGGKRHKIEAGALEQSYAELYEVMLRTYSTPSRSVAGREAKMALESALSQLPEHYAEVIRAYDLEGCPIEEAAERVKRTAGATYMLRARAHDRLAEVMGSASRYFTGG